MDDPTIRRLRNGQGNLRAHQLAAALIQRGILTPTEAHELKQRCEPDAFEETILRRELLSPDQIGEIDREARLNEIFDAVTPAPIPAEVGAALADTVARVGKFVLIELLGRGGMGEVWKAWDTQLRRWVALKFLRDSEEADPQLLKRFFREANLVSQMSHPSIVRIYEVAMSPRRPYIAMEFLEGKSLDGVRLERRRAAQAVRDAARAVQYAHDRGVIHRDLKPPNLMECADGRIVVLDFGLARPVGGAKPLTVDGALLGTPAYMAPEQATGRATGVWTDVYGLGATLYALVEGRAPFAGTDNFHIVHLVAAFRPAPLAVRDDLSVIVGRAMEREPKDRYGSARDLADDLDRYLQGEPIRARPIGTLQRALRRVRRHPLSAAAGAILFAALAAGSYAGLRHARDLRGRERADTELVQAERLLSLLREMRARDPEDPASLERALSDFESRVDTALVHAPDYERALFYRGLALELRGQHPEAERVFTGILRSDPRFHDARAARGLSRLAQIPRLPIRGVQEPGGFRIEFAPYAGADADLLHGASEDFERLPPEHPEHEFGRAVVDLCLGKAPQAADRLGRVVQREPYRLDTRLHLALAYLLQGAYAESEAEAGRLLTRRFTLVKVHQCRAFARAAQGKFSEAVEDLEEALPKEEALRPFHAAWLSHLGRFEDALRDYDRLVRDFPRNSDHRLNRARVHMQLGHRAQAREDAEESCRINPGDPLGHLQRALTLDDPRQAIEACTRSLDLDPRQVPARVLRARHLTTLQELDRAGADLLEAVRMEPDNLSWRFDFATNLHLRGQFEKAVEEFAELLRRDPDHLPARYHRAQSLEQLRLGALAKSDYTEIVRRVAPRVDAGQATADEYEMRAAAQAYLGRFREAVDDATKALAKEPGRVSVHLLRAQWLARLDRHAEAVRDYDAVLNRFPDSVPSLWGRSESRLRSGDWEGALRDAEETCRLAPDQGVSFCNRGLARYALKEFAGALADFREAIRLDPRLEAGLRGPMEECAKR